MGIDRISDEVQTDLMKRFERAEREIALSAKREGTYAIMVIVSTVAMVSMFIATIYWHSKLNESEDQGLFATERARQCEWSFEVEQIRHQSCESQLNRMIFELPRCGVSSTVTGTATGGFVLFPAGASSAAK